MAQDLPVFGLDAELAQKRNSQYDPELEAEARRFIEEKTGLTLSGTFHEALKNGQSLCKLVNALSPGKIKKINTGKLAFTEMENIAAYLDACRDFGLKNFELFQTVDLYEAKNMNQVIINIVGLKRATGGGLSKPAVPTAAIAPSYGPTPVERSKPAAAPAGAPAPALASSGSSAKFCSGCGTKATGGKFCSSCGAQL